MKSDKTVLDNLFTQRSKFTDIANMCKDTVANYTNVLLQSMAEEYAFQILRESYEKCGWTYLGKEKIIEAIKMKDPRFTEEDVLGGLKRLNDTGKAELDFEDEQDGGRLNGIILKVEKK